MERKHHFLSMLKPHKYEGFVTVPTLYYYYYYYYYYQLYHFLAIFLTSQSVFVKIHN